MKDMTSLLDIIKPGLTDSYTKNISKHRHKESEYWANKLKKRRVLSKIQKASRKRNRY